MDSGKSRRSSRGSYDQIGQLNRVIQDLLGKNPWYGRITVGALALGILFGALGNFAALPAR